MPRLSRSGSKANGFVPAGLLLAFFCLSGPAGAAEPASSLNVYGGRMTFNKWQEVFTNTFGLDYADSYFLAVTYARQVGQYRDAMSFEVEGQAVKHFNYMDHWEFNGAFVSRWHRFAWDETIDTSLAFGIGLSLATDLPQVELDTNDETTELLIYWMIELALKRPKNPNVEYFARLHHRSDAWGLMNQDGGSNGIGFGIKYRF